MPDSLTSGSGNGDQTGFERSPTNSEPADPNKRATLWKPARILLVVFARFITATGNILLSIVITQAAGLGTLGPFTVLVSGSTFAILMAKGGLGVAYLRAGSRMQLRQDAQSQGLILSRIQRVVLTRSFALAVITGLICLVYLGASDAFNIVTAALLATTIFSLASLSIVSEHFKSKSMVDLAMLLTPGLVSLLTSLAIAGFVFSFGVTDPLDLSSIVLVYASLCALVAVIAQLLVRWNQKASLSNLGSEKFNDGDLNEIEDEIKSSSSNFLKIHLLTYGSFSGLFIVAAFFFSDEELGMIRLSERLAAPVLISLSIINPLIAARLSQLYGAKQIQKLRSVVWNTSKVCIALTILLVIASLIGIPYLLKALIEDDSTALALIVVMLAGNAINLAFGPLGMVLSMANREKALQKISTWTMMAALLLCLGLSYFFGSYGFCLAIALSYTIKNLMMYYVYNKEFK